MKYSNLLKKLLKVTCCKVILLLVTVSYMNGFAQTDCDNLGFVSGDLTDWDFYVGCHPNAIPFFGAGYCHVAGGPGETQGCCPDNRYVTNGENAGVKDPLARHTLCSGAVLDFYTKFSVVPPKLAGYKKSNYSLRLGNANKFGQADRFSRTFEINDDNAIFAYHFAFVLNDPADDYHVSGTGMGDAEVRKAPYYGLPYFEAKFIRENGDTIPCSSLLVMANDDNFEKIVVEKDTVRFKTWTPVFLNLEKYLGEKLTLEFTNSDCARSGHWGYSYVSAYCGAYKPMENISLCLNDTTTITSPFPIEGFELLWSTGDTTETIEVVGDANKTITLKVKNRVPIGQMAVCEEEYAVEITVGESPVPVLENDTVCEGGSVALVAEPSGLNYDWYTTPTGGVPFHSGDSYTTPALTNSVTYYVMNPSKCASDERVPVTVDVIKVTADAGSDQIICKGDNIQLTASGGGGYLWQPNDGSLNNVNIANPLASPQVTTVYTVTVTDDRGMCSSTDEVTVFVQEIAPVIGGVNVCIGDTTDFTNLTIPTGVGNVTWLWDFGDGVQSNERVPTHTYANPGVYEVKMNVKAGVCEGEASVNVEVYPNPIAAFEPNPRKTTVESPMITFIDQTRGGVSGVWDFGDGFTAPYEEGVDQIHTYYASNEKEGPFLYTIRLTVETEHGCKDEVVEEIEIENVWTIYVPNVFTPNGDGYNDLFKAFGMGILNFNMMVYNRWGEVVFRTDDINKGWDGTSISGNEIKQDVYVWKVKAKNNRGKILRLVGHVTLTQ